DLKMSEGDATQLALEKGSPQVSNDDGSSSPATVHKLKVDTEDAGSKIESPTPEKLESRSKWVVYFAGMNRSQRSRSIELLEKHKDLLNLFNRMESSIRLLRLRKRMATFNNIATQVEILAKRGQCRLPPLPTRTRNCLPHRPAVLRTPAPQPPRNPRSKARTRNGLPSSARSPRTPLRIPPRTSCHPRSGSARRDPGAQDGTTWIWRVGSVDNNVKFWDLETFELIGSSGPEDDAAEREMAIMRAKALAATPPTQQQLMASSYPFSLSPKGGGTSKKIENPNGRVGVIIGKAGETIRYIQLQSGAKIQVTRDHEAEPGALTRQVELSGKPEQISKAEQLIKEVLAEADAGSSGARSGGRKYNATQQGAETYQMKIANNKVGLIIRKGGETIKSMQTKSGARIQ
ncbi:hypothetical protein ACJX0J_041779, partial [Zea mays]